MENSPGNNEDFISISSMKDQLSYSIRNFATQQEQWIQAYFAHIEKERNNERQQLQNIIAQHQTEIERLKEELSRRDVSLVTRLYWRFHWHLCSRRS
jgi:hypothetical protein